MRYVTLVLRSNTKAVLGDGAIRPAGSSQLALMPTGTRKYSAGMLAEIDGDETRRDGRAQILELGGDGGSAIRL